MTLTPPTRPFHLLSLLAVLATSTATAAGTNPRYLCTADETVLFGCRSGDRMISLCASQGFTSRTGYVQYRFGAPGNVELAWPHARLPASGRFWFSSVTYAGGAEDHLRFVNHGIEYVLFDRMTRTDFGPGGQREPDMAEGVVVRVPGKRPAVTRCTDRGAGAHPEIDGIDKERFDMDKGP